MKKKLTHTLAIFTIKHIERSPDLTAASLIKLTQMIKEKDMLKHEGIEKKIKKARKTKNYIKKLLTEGKSWLG